MLTRVWFRALEYSVLRACFTSSISETGRDSTVEVQLVYLDQQLQHSPVEAHKLQLALVKY